MSNIFEDVDRQLREESKCCLPELKSIITMGSDSFYKQFNLISKPVLELLLDKSIEKIAQFENPNYYEEDAMDILCDCEFVFEDLINECIDHCELFNEDKGEYNGSTRTN